jgi:hypothetical protein
MCQFSFYKNAFARFDQIGSIQINAEQMKIALAIATLLGADKHGQIKIEDKHDANKLNVVLERDFDKYTLVHGFVMSIDI